MKTQMVEACAENYGDIIEGRMKRKAYRGRRRTWVE